MSADFVCNQEIVIAARRNLPQNVWDYLTGAAESETTLRRNRMALDSIAFQPRVLRDVAKVDARGAFLGHKLRIPVLNAPIGSLQTIVAGGGVAACRAAASFGTIQMISSVTQPALEECARAAEAPKIFQLYIRGDMSWIEGIVNRAKLAGYVALALTVDSSHYGMRERQLMNRWLPPSVRVQENRHLQAAVTWQQMAQIKALWGGPFILKGIATVADAKLAVEHGVEAIYISNHGGRQLDHGRGTMEMLPEIADAVKGRAEIVIDGGFLRGSDIVKAIALGAKAAAIGRLQGWALAAAGEAGLIRALEILENEMINTMGLLGVTRLAELGPDYVCKTTPVGPCHEMSTFFHMPGGRLV